jgi:hypothetical protein
MRNKKGKHWLFGALALQLSTSITTLLVYSSLMNSWDGWADQPLVYDVSQQKTPSSKFLWNVQCVESLQSHFILTRAHWSSRQPFCFQSQGTRVQIPKGYLCETGILLLALSIFLLALSRYIGDPDVIDHCGLLWGRPRPEQSLGPRADNAIIPLDLTQLSCPGFMLVAGLPSGFTTTESTAGGSPVESLQSHFILNMSHWSSGLPVCFPSQRTQV